MRRTISGTRAGLTRNEAKVSLARALSKAGYCSRTQARALIEAGRVLLDGVCCRDPERRVDPARARIAIDDQPLTARAPRYIMLNKPRGLVTTRSDEQQRNTVYDCFAQAALPHLSPVGRLDKASEGLLLFTNDTRWAEGITSPATGPDKVYHVQIDTLPDDALVSALRSGVELPGGERLAVKHVERLRQGERHGWLEITLDEGRNRHIRRLLEALSVGVLRLVRVRIGPVQLGALAKGQWRDLDAGEIESLRMRQSVP